MAAECARNALLQKVMDNKEDAGTVYCSMYTSHIILFCLQWFLYCGNCFISYPVSLNQHFVFLFFLKKILMI